MKRSLKLAVVFSIVMFFMITITVVFMGLVFVILYHIGIIHPTRNPAMIFAVFTAVSIVLGTILSRFGGKKMIAPIIEISEATKQVAKGNFDIQLKEKTRAREVNIMAQNFQLMTQELKNTETFHNDFIHNVSHEFKTPLSAIEGYATLLQNKYLSPEKQEIYIAKILFNTKRLTTLTGNILQLTRLENKEITTEKRWFSLDEQLREDILLFEEEWNRKHLELDIDLDSVEYFGNSDMLSLVWQNLIGNAVKYVHDGGNIRVILRKEELSVKIYVSDNGIGMNEEVKKRVFEKFFQGDTSHSSEGNGLGLTLAKRIVDLHGGAISLSSKQGKGTTFTVSLPYESEEP